MQQTCTEGVLDMARLDLKGDPLESFCKRLNFNHITKWYIKKPEFSHENATQKILWDFEIQTNHMILARRPDLMLINKKKWERELAVFVDFAELTDSSVKRK